jgi:hypothetical protein
MRTQEDVINVMEEIQLHGCLWPDRGRGLNSIKGSESRMISAR